MKKPRCDAHLKTLPIGRQEGIIEYMRDHKPSEVMAWLREDGVQTSAGALSEFWSWWHLARQLQHNESTVAAMLQELRREEPGLTDEQLLLAGQRFFSALAIEQRDSLAWKRAVDARIKAQTVKVLERRVALLERKAEQADQAKATMSDQGLTEEQKQARLREIFGMR